jgi:N-acyl-phosphatidylethanolamine-hydrolysing phospholipase D
LTAIKHCHRQNVSVCRAIRVSICRFGEGGGRVNLRYFLIMTALVCGVQAVAQPQASRLFEPAPRDGTGAFMNPVGDLSQGSLGVRVPFMLRRFGTYFRGDEGAPRLMLPKDQPIQVEDSTQATVTWVGHATVLVQMPGVTFLMDPIWSDWPSPVPFIGPRRYVPPGIAIEDLPPIDFVVISHNHYDHLDLPTLKALAERDAKTQFLVPLGNESLLQDQGISQVHGFDWGDAMTINGSMVYCLPTQHWSKRGLTDTNRSLWASWAVIGASKRFYFAGDTGYFKGFKAIGETLGPFDLAAMPIGAYEPTLMMQSTHMNPEEAVQAAIDVQANKALAIHFGTFDLSDEPLSEPPERFKAAAVEALSVEDAWVIKIGERRVF